MLKTFFNKLNKKDFAFCFKYSKRAYDKKSAISAINYRMNKGVKYLRIYQCKECNMWHLTKQNDYANFKIKDTFKKKQNSEYLFENNV